MNQPETLSRAMVGRRMNFPRNDEWQSPIISLIPQTFSNIAQADAENNCLPGLGAKFGSKSYVPLRAPSSELDLKFRVDFSQSSEEEVILGVPLHTTNRRQWRKFLVVFKCRDKLCANILDDKGSTRSSLQSGKTLLNGWVEVGLKISDHLFSVYFHRQFDGAMKMPRRARMNDMVYLGGIPLAVQRKMVLPPGFTGCMDQVELNGESVSLWSKVRGQTLETCQANTCSVGK